MMPFIAILRHDLRGLWASWLVRLWILTTALLALLQVLSNWNQFQTAPLIAMLLFPYLIFPWSLVVMMLSVVPVSGGHAEVAADAFLSRPVTRYAYLLAAWAARVIVVLSVFLVVTVPAIAAVTLAKRPTPPDTVTLYGTIASLAVVGLVLTFLVSVGFLLGVVLRNTWLAVTLLVFLWFPINLLLHTFSLEEFSPISLTQSLPTLLRQPWYEADQASRPPETDIAFQDALRFFGSLSGGPAAVPPRDQDFFASGNYRDFSLRRVLLGYGVPLLTALVTATWCFCRRDL